ncbi:MAG: RNA polymerase sigma-70 factor [Marinilabiliales bacterium]|nr:RNA polymerase sigma-70 factor [Marinilabiliales bacterium]
MLKKGEKSAYRALYRQYYSQMFHLAFHYLKEREVAEEIVQDTFLRLWEVRETIDPEQNIHNFLFTLTKNGALNWLRNQKSAHRHQQEIRYKEWHYNQLALERLGDLYELKELQQKIDAAIDRLPEDLKETFVMNRFENLTYKEIAERQSVSIKTIEFRISKVLRQFRIEFADYLCAFLILIRMIRSIH